MPYKLFLYVALIACVSACGGGDDTASDDNTTLPKPTATPKAASSSTGYAKAGDFVKVGPTFRDQNTVLYNWNRNAIDSDISIELIDDPLSEPTKGDTLKMTFNGVEAELSFEETVTTDGNRQYRYSGAENDFQVVYFEDLDPNTSSDSDDSTYVYTDGRGYDALPLSALYVYIDPKNEEDIEGFHIIGYNTDPADMPTSGNGVYTGRSQMYLNTEAFMPYRMHSYRSGRLYSGDATFTVNFATSAIEGSTLLENNGGEAEQILVTLDPTKITGNTFAGTPTITLPQDFRDGQTLNFTSAGHP